MFENVDEVTAEVVGKYLAGAGIGVGLYLTAEGVALGATDKGRDADNDGSFGQRAAQNVVPGVGGAGIYNAVEVPMEMEMPELTYEDPIIAAGAHNGYTAIRELYRYGYDV